VRRECAKSYNKTIVNKLNKQQTINDTISFGKPFPEKNPHSKAHLVAA
jgi:hypothetical protein